MNPRPVIFVVFGALASLISLFSLVTGGLAVFAGILWLITGLIAYAFTYWTLVDIREYPNALARHQAAMQTYNTALTAYNNAVNAYPAAVRTAAAAGNPVPQAPIPPTMPTAPNPPSGIFVWMATAQDNHLPGNFVAATCFIMGLVIYFLAGADFPGELYLVAVLVLAVYVIASPSGYNTASMIGVSLTVTTLIILQLSGILNSTLDLTGAFVSWGNDRVHEASRIVESTTVNRKMVKRNTNLYKVSFNHDESVFRKSKHFTGINMLSNPKPLKRGDVVVIRDITQKLLVYNGEKYLIVNLPTDTKDGSAPDSYRAVRAEDIDLQGQVIDYEDLDVKASEVSHNFPVADDPIMLLRKGENKLKIAANSESGWLKFPTGTSGCSMYSNNYSSDGSIKLSIMYENGEVEDFSIDSDGNISGNLPVPGRLFKIQSNIAQELTLSVES